MDMFIHVIMPTSIPDIIFSYKNFSFSEFRKKILRSKYNLLKYGNSNIMASIIVTTWYSACLVNPGPARHDPDVSVRPARSRIPSLTLQTAELPPTSMRREVGICPDKISSIHAQLRVLKNNHNKFKN